MPFFDPKNETGGTFFDAGPINDTSFNRAKKGVTNLAVSTARDYSDSLPLPASQPADPNILGITSIKPVDQSVLGIPSSQVGAWRTPEQMKSALGNVAGSFISTGIGVGKGMSMGLLDTSAANRAMPSLGLRPDPLAETAGEMVGLLAPWNVASKIMPAMTGISNVSKLGRIANEAITGGTVTGIFAQNQGQDAATNSVVGALFSGTIASAMNIPTMARWFKGLSAYEQDKINVDLRNGASKYADLVAAGKMTMAQAARENSDYFKTLWDRSRATSPVTEKFQTATVTPAKQPMTKFQSSPKQPSDYPDTNTLAEAEPAVAAIETTVIPEYKPSDKITTSGPVNNIEIPDQPVGPLGQTVVRNEVPPSFNQQPASTFVKPAAISLSTETATQKIISTPTAPGVSPDTPIQVAQEAVKTAKQSGTPLKEQKKFLLKNIDDAVVNAPELLTTEYNNAKNNLENIRAERNSYEESMRKALIKIKELDPVTDQRPIAELQLKYDLAKVKYNKLTKEKSDIKQSLATEGAYVTIDVPNDGTFQVYNSKQALNEFKSAVSKSFPSGVKTKETVGYGTLPKPRSPFVPSAYDGVQFTATSGIWHTDGPSLIKGPATLPLKGPNNVIGKWKDWEQNSPEDQQVTINKVIPTENLDKVDKVSFVNAASGGEHTGISDKPLRSIGGDELYTILQSGDKRTVLYQDYYNYVSKIYPKAEWHIGDTPVSPVVAKVNSEVVAVVMPIKDTTRIIEISRQVDLQATSRKSPLQAGRLKNRSHADTGGYNLNPPGPQSTPFGQQKVNAIELPEILEIAKELMDGRLPQVVRKLRHSGALGVFYASGHGDIKVLAALFKVPGLAERVLGHEIGHLADYLPDRTLARGNILGHIASLKKYMKQLLAEYEGAPGASLTPQERARLRAEAERELKANERPEETIIETITREIPEWKYVGITPDMIKALLGLDAKELYPKLYRAFQEMDTAAKKSVLIAAMKGMVHERVSRFGERIQTGTKTVTEQVSRTIPGISATPDQIAKRYAELVQAEIDKRYLYKREIIKQELQDLSLHWKPFTPGVNQFTKYRFSPVELYADAISVVLNNPDLLRRIAPTFEKAFFSYINKKPELRDIYYAIQQRLNNPDTVGKARLDALYEMHRESDIKQQEMIKRGMREEEGLKAALMKRFVDERWAAKNIIKQVSKIRGNDTLAAQALQHIEDIPYLSSEVNQILYDLNNAVLKPIEEADLTLTDVSIYQFAKQIISEGARGVTMAAAKGHTPVTAQRILFDLEDKLGHTKFAAVEKVSKDFRNFNETVFIAEFEKSGYFTDAQIKLMKEREDYATIFIQKFFEEDPSGMGGITAKIYQKFGSLEDVANVFTMTLLKYLSFLRAVRINTAKFSFVQILKSGGDDFIKLADKKYSLDTKRMVAIPPKDRDMAILRVKNSGIWEEYYADKELVGAFEYQPVVAVQMVRYWQKAVQVLKEIFVSKNPKWILNNIPRDFQRSLVSVGEIRLRDAFAVTRAYYSVFKDVWKFTHGGARSPQITRMMKEKTLPVKRTWESIEQSYDNEVVRMFVDYGLSAQSNNQWRITKTLKPINDWIENTAATSDVWGKVATDKWLFERPMMTQSRRTNLIRNQVGTPNWKNKGTYNEITNSLYLFSNVGVQGLRSAATAYKENPGRFMWKMFMLNIVPKLLMKAAAVGLAGHYLQKVFDKIPDYDKRVYCVVPLYINKDGKAEYLRFPNDYEGQWLGSLVWNAMSGKITGKNSAAGTVTAAVPYTFNPLITIGGTLAEYYSSGNTSVDSYTGMPILTEDERRAGGKYAAAALGRYAWNKVLSTVYRSETGSIQTDISTKERALKIFGLNAFGSFYRISDKGDDERIQEALDKVRGDAAAARIESMKALQKLVRGDVLTQDDKVAIATHKGDIGGNIAKMLAKKNNLKYINALQQANTPKEKLAIVELMSDNQR